MVGWCVVVGDGDGSVVSWCYDNGGVVAVFCGDVVVGYNVVMVVLKVVEL